MKVTASRKIPYVALATVLIGVGATALSVWRVFASQPKNVMHSNSSSLKRGVGGQVKFASHGASSDEIATSVTSVDTFIYRRSGLKMSDATKNKLVEAEGEALNTGRRLSPENLASSFANIVTTRLANLTDEEIERAANDFVAPGDQLALRAREEWAFSSKTAFIKELQDGRETSRRQDYATVKGLRETIAKEIGTQITSLGDALPEQFQNIKSEGVTPLQALLLGYSIATGDTLEMSQSEINAQVIQQRSFSGQSRNLAIGRKSESSRAYGIGGAVKSSPFAFLLDKTFVSQIIEGGAKK